MNEESRTELQILLSTPNKRFRENTIKLNAAGLDVLTTIEKN